MQMKIVASIDAESEGLLPILNGGSGLELETVHPASLIEACDGLVAAVLICANSFREIHRACLRQLRESGYGGSVLVISKLESAEMLDELRRQRNAHFLERPYDPRDLLGLIAKFAGDLDVSQRIHRRYATDEAAEVEANGVRSKSIVRNLSKGGAYVEVEDGPMPKAGSTVVLKIALGQLRRAYSMRAKVVWVSLSGSNGRAGLGMEFLGPADQQRRIVGLR
jgi:Tfp pilus assembly protein PilZ